MVFSSLSFLYFFLPMVLALYFIFPGIRWKNAVLLIFSLFFYSWGEPRHILLMLAAGFAAWLGGMLMARFRAAGKDNAEKAAYVITLVLLLGNLFCFKYLNFVTENLFKLFGVDRAATSIVLPIGISFYTFQIMSYVIDLHRRQISLQKSPFRLMLYLSLFPQLIAGPIVRYQTVEEEISCRSSGWGDIISGTERFVIGLGKKLIIANGVAPIAELIFAGDTAIYGTAMMWIAALAYTLQIYFDFSGYSDMAIGLGRIFGFHFLENFDYPYRALSITEFWRRWHISLSSWFRDYVYIPMGGNRVSKGRWVLNLSIVWALTGFWHGAEWNFLFWGLYYGCLLILEKLFLKKYLDRLPMLLRWTYTFVIVMVGWVIFYHTDMGTLLESLRVMFSFTPTVWHEMIGADTGVLKGLIYLPLGMFFAFPVKWLKVKSEALRIAVCLVLFAICVMFTVSTSYNPFIYFRF